MNVGKFLDLDNGIPSQQNALLHSTGAADSDKIIKLDEAGKLSNTVMPVGVVADTEAVLASESLTTGDLVQIWDDGGTPKVRRADATAINKFSTVGFVLNNFALGETALVYFDGRITGLTGLTIGERYYTSETPGQITLTAPTTNEALVQAIGRALTATSLTFEKSVGIVLAPAEV
jgi:hypothetical protein